MDIRMTKERSAFARFFTGIWRLVDGARKVFLNLLFLAIVYFVVMAFIETGETLVIQSDTALVLRPYGDVVEEFTGTPFDVALQQVTEQDRNETRLRDMVDAIRRAKDDPRIVRLVIVPSNMWRIGMAALREVEAAVADFKSSGKPVVAIADNLSQQQYYLAAMADEIWLHPNGMIWIDGFAVYRQFYREGLEKLEVDVNLFRVGEYKSAMEPYIRDDMSPEARESNLYWIGGLWQQYLEGISGNRGVPLQDLSAAVNDFANRLEAADGDFARLAEELGLVDRLISRPEALLALAAAGAPGEGSEGFRQVHFENYLALTDLQHFPGSARKIAVVVAEGEIVRGRQPPGVIGAETVGDRLKALAENRNVAAVVVRINSPGGEVFAAERIRREIQALRELGKTVVVSMGDVAASGGYWIAMAADEVWASPSTITGSIGVYGIIPTFEKPLEKLGIHTDGVGTTPLAGKLRMDRKLDPDLRRIFQIATEKTYRDFVRLVADARQMSAEDVDRVAQGRVWNGAQAKERGLVDQTGTLSEAIDAAARIAGLGMDFDVLYEERELSTFEELLIQITGGAMAKLGWAGSNGLNLRNTLLENLLEDLRTLSRNAGEFTVAAHCLCRVE
jgi:protease-4